MKKLLFLLVVVTTFSCKVTFITGYDAILDETTTKIKKDFNLFWLGLDRSLHDKDPNNQKFENYQDFYDHLTVDIMALNDRADVLPPKSALVQKQVKILSELIQDWISKHKKGLKDIEPNATVADDYHDLRDGINRSLNAIIKLQEELKNSGKATTK